MAAPKPKGMKLVIRARIASLLKADAVPDYEALADAVQDIWPGASAQQVRGVAGNIFRSKNKGVTETYGLVTRAPWKPGDPRPTDLSSSDKKQQV